MIEWLRASAFALVLILFVTSMVSYNFLALGGYGMLLFSMGWVYKMEKEKVKVVEAGK